MRKIVLSFLLSIALLPSCSHDNASAEREALLEAERDSLRVLATANQQQLDRMTSFFDDVAACIDSITEQETILASQVDIETNRRYSSHELALRLNQLSDIITDQRNKIAMLVDSLNNRVDTVRTEGLRSTIAYLTNQLAQKEEQINRLKSEISGHKRNIRNLTDKVENLTAAVDELSTQNTALTEAVQVQTEIINEAYVLVATKQELKDMGVIQGGGFLRSAKTDLSSVDKSKCSKVDIATFTRLPVNSGKVKLLSPAPRSSYSLTKNGGVTILSISDANSFWSLSNILVIQIQ